MDFSRGSFVTGDVVDFGTLISLVDVEETMVGPTVTLADADGTAVVADLHALTRDARITSMSVLIIRLNISFSTVLVTG